jgi:hypothetical protein
LERAGETQDPKPLEKLEANVRKASGAWLAEMADRNGILSEIAAELETLGPLPEGVSVSHGSNGPNLSVDGRDYRSLRLVPLMAKLVHEELRTHVRGFIDLEKPL